MYEGVGLIGDLGQRQEIIRTKAGTVFPVVPILVRAGERHAVHGPAVVAQVNLSLPDRGTEHAVSDRMDRRV